MTISASQTAVLTAGPAMPLRPELAARWTFRCCRALVFLTLFSLIFIPEYPDGNDSFAGALLYRQAVGRFRVVDLGLLLLITLHGALFTALRSRRLQLPVSLRRPGVLFVLCIALAAFRGFLKDGSNLFFDWRALALGVGLYLVWACWIDDAQAAAEGGRLFLAFGGLLITLVYALYFTGHGHTLLGQSIPLYDGPALSCLVCLVLMGLSCRAAAKKPVIRLSLFFIGIAGSALLLLCFRRTYWAELVLGISLLFCARRERWLRNCLLFGILALAVAWCVPSPISARLHSLDMSQSEDDFSADNSDHVNDLLDAWDQVRKSPVLGVGLGTEYETWRIRNWKGQSVMVHNAPLHVWMKYGAFGLTAYLWFHAALLRWLYKISRQPHASPLCAAAFAYIAAQLLVTLGFAPWPYSELQLTILLSFLLAIAAAGANHNLSSPVRLR